MRLRLRLRVIGNVAFALAALAGAIGCHRASPQATPSEDASARDAAQTRPPIRRPRPHQPREVPDDSTEPHR